MIIVSCRFRDPFPYDVSDSKLSFNDNKSDDKPTHKSEKDVVLNVPSIPLDHLINLPLSIPPTAMPTNDDDGGEIEVILGSSSYHRKLVLGNYNLD